MRASAFPSGAGVSAVPGAALGAQRSPEYAGFGPGPPRAQLCPLSPEAVLGGNQAVCAVP